MAAHVRLEVIEADIQTVDHVEEVILEDEFLAGQVQHLGCALEFAEELETMPDLFRHLEQVLLFVEHGLASELEGARVLLDVAIIRLHLAQEATGLVEPSEDVFARLKVLVELGKVLAVDLFLRVLDRVLDAREPIVELLH